MTFAILATPTFYGYVYFRAAWIVAFADFPIAVHFLLLIEILFTSIKAHWLVHDAIMRVWIVMNTNPTISFIRFTSADLIPCTCTYTIDTENAPVLDIAQWQSISYYLC